MQKKDGELRDREYVLFAWFSNGHVKVCREVNNEPIRIRTLDSLDELREHIEQEETHESQDNGGPGSRLRKPNRDQRRKRSST